MASCNESSNNDLTGDNTLGGLEIIRINHDEAYLYISQALSYEEQKQFDLARDMYEKGLEKIDKALNVRCDRQYCVGPKWDAARKSQQKMRKTVQMIRSQMQCLPTTNSITSPSYTPPEPFEMPPSYDEACEHEVIASPRRSSCPIDASEVNAVVSCGTNGVNGMDKRSSEVVEVFCIPTGVQIFYVSLDGSVSTSASLTSLYIYQFTEVPCDNTNKPPAWLQVGSWTYPLIPGQSPVLESAYGAFLFPNVGAGRDSAVGVILPSSVNYVKRKEFLDILNKLTALKEEKTIVPYEKDHTSSSETFSDTLSRGIVTGAEYLSAGIVKGASLTSELIHKGAGKAKERLQPEERAITVDPRVRDGLKIARDASGVALSATGFLVKRLGDLTVALGRHIAPFVREQGTKFLTSALKKDSADAKQTMDSVLTVAAGGLQGFSTVYMGLESAARTLAYSLSSETVNIVDHKYGREVGEVVGNAVFSIGNLALTTHNVQSLGVKSVAKRTAKDTGKAVLKDYVESVKIPEK